MPRAGRSSSRAQPAAAASSSSKKKPSKKTKARSRATALDAFAIAAKQVQPDRKVLAHGRDQYLHPEPGQGHKKHRRDEEEDEEDEDGSDGNDAPRKKKQRPALDDGGEAGSDDDMESDSEGHEWRVGVDADDDSDIDSDEAFDEDDEERFEGFAFRGSSSKGPKKEKADLSEGEEDEEGSDDSLGEDAIDLAQALDQASDDESSAGDSDSGSGEDDESASESPDEDEEDEEDPSKLGALQSLVRGYAGAEDDESGAADGQSKAKISLSDLGLFGVKDPHMKKSLKLLNKEEKAAKPGSTKKLDVPLAKRQQDRLLRAAAQEKTNETLDRWTDTVKHNRRADHLVFPLPHTLPNAGLDNGELLPLTRKAAASELEQTIMSIMEESGLGPSARDKEQQERRAAEEAEADAAQSISRADLQELWAQRRRDRELKSHEQARSKRIKKIKSKTYRRIHRREQLRDDQAAEEAMAAEGGGPDSEEEREALHRQRAMERMGARHRESKWAKRAAKVGRAAWDDEVRAGLTDMARRDAELRRRIEGRAGSSDDDEDGAGGSGSGSEDDGDDRARLLKKLDDLEKEEGDDDDDAPQSKLMGMKFMQRAEAQRKKENDELVAQMRRELLSDAEDQDEDGEQAEVGRRAYGVPKARSQGRAEARQEAVDGAAGDRPAAPEARSKAPALSLAQSAAEPPSSGPGAAGAWSRAGATERRRDKKHGAGPAPAELDLHSSVLIARPARTRTKTETRAADGRPPDSEASGSEGEADLHLPLALRDHALVARAFAGEDVVGAFEAEKAAAASEDDEKVVDNTLPGWGSWVGEGVSERERRRHQGRFLAKKEGVRKADRRDAKMERVIVNERRVKKNDKYLASQLPHPFESRDQYERSLRLPLGPEWVTKESFQDATKPRVIIKQGVIAPMLKPLV